MGNKTILIAETHKEQSELIKQAIKRNNINIAIIEIETNNGKQMKEAILDAMPDIVLSNEVKSDLHTTEIIQEIQSDISNHQPIFIISSGFSTSDIDLICKDKEICAYSSKKPSDFDLLAIEIGNIVNDRETNLNKHMYYNFSEENLQTAAHFMEDNACGYMYNPKYKQINHELSELNKELSKLPQKIKEKFDKFEDLQVMNNMYENCFIYQYFNNKINKV